MEVFNEAGKGKSTRLQVKADAAASRQIYDTGPAGRSWV